MPFLSVFTINWIKLYDQIAFFIMYLKFHDPSESLEKQLALGTETTGEDGDAKQPRNAFHKYRDYSVVYSYSGETFSAKTGDT